MSASLVSRVIYGFRIEKKIDRWDEKYSPYIEGHPGVNVLMFNSEGRPNVWCCGIVLVSSNDGIYRVLDYYTLDQYFELKCFAQKFFPEVEKFELFMLNMME